MLSLLTVVPVVLMVERLRLLLFDDVARAGFAGLLGLRLHKGL